MKAEGFPTVSIFRPGTLDRGPKARWNEKLASKLLTMTPVKDVATAMIVDAQASRPGLHVYEVASIFQAATTGKLS